MRINLILSGLIIFTFLVALAFAQRKPEDEKAISGDFKITTRTTMAGHTTQTTSMIKGLRERDETGFSYGNMSQNVVTITQCDLRRTVKINDAARKYLVSPMEVENNSSSAGNAGNPSSESQPSEKGGLVTVAVNTVDTGERKQMFGYNARHLKRTTTTQASADACQQQQYKVETDGWYINLEYGLSCPSQQSGQGMAQRSTGGCRDRYQYKHTGPTNLGYPLVETTTMFSPNGQVSFSMTKEVVDLSLQPLDAALFDIPSGYTEVTNQQDLYPVPSAADFTNRQQTSTANQETPAATEKPAERIKVGIVEFDNKTKSSVSSDSLRDQLIAALSNQGVEGIALNASSPSEADIEAKAKGCAYILYTEIATFKSPSTAKKLGGFLNNAARNGSGSSAKAEVRFDFKLVPTGQSSATVQSSASGKEDTQEASATAAIQDEAQAVVRGVRKM